MGNYQIQVRRTKRYYLRFQKINDGIAHNAHSETYFDDIYTFFMHCYHIKDYLKNDAEYINNTDSEIESYITNTPELALCADICNGIKHLNLDRTRSGSVPDYKSGEIHINIVEEMAGQKTDVKVSCKVIVKHEGLEIDAFDLATNAMNAWQSFIPIT